MAAFATLPDVQTVLSSASLCKVDFSIVKNRSLIKLLKERGPKIEPCDTPVMILWYLLKLSPILAPCFLLVK